MDRRKIMKLMMVGGGSLSLTGVSQAAADINRDIEIKKVAGSSKAIALSWSPNQTEDYTYHVYANGEKLVETSDTNYRITELDNESQISVRIVGKSSIHDQPDITGRAVLVPSRPEIQLGKTEETLPRDIDPDSYDGTPSREDLREIFRQGNMECE